MPEQYIFRFVHERFSVAHGQIVLLSQWLKAHTIDQTVFQKGSVSCVVDVLVYQISDLAVRQFF